VGRAAGLTTMRDLLRRDRGFTLIEALAALAVAAILVAGAAAMIHSALNDIRGHHTGRYQAKVVEASERYIREHYADLLTATGPGSAAVPLAVLAPLLPEGFAPTNPFGQVLCLRVIQPSPGRLNALIVAEGGLQIPTKDLAYVAAQSGPGGGQITAEEPGVAQGAYGSWRVDVPAYGTAACGAAPGGTPAENRLASALFFDGPETSASDFLYRGEVPGHPELNALSMPLAMTGRAVAIPDDAGDPLCSAGDPLSQGRIAVSAAGVLLSCQSGAWRRQGSAFWKDPVPGYATLPTAGNLPGDTRLVLDVMRAFSWDGAEWRALSVDQDGDMAVPRQLALISTVVRGTPCAPDGALSREPTGLTVSCQLGRWKTLGSVEIDPSQSEIGASVILPSNYMAYPPGTSFYAGTLEYDMPNDGMTALVERYLLPTKDGLIISNVSADMSTLSLAAPSSNGQLGLLVRVVDRDTGAVIATNRAMSTRYTNDRATLAVTLSKAVPLNTNGYTFQMYVLWTRYTRTYEGNFWNRASYLDTLGQVVELTPLALSWSIDLTY
jgi:prepilin-type N-terminal cleavage/methylation domain-containing protein